MRIKDIIEEGAFDDMVSTIANLPQKGPGRWPSGNKSQRRGDKERGSTEKTSSGAIHKAGANYSGDRYRDPESATTGTRTGPSIKKKSLDQLKGPKR